MPYWCSKTEITGKNEHKIRIYSAGRSICMCSLFREYGAQKYDHPSRVLPTMYHNPPKIPKRLQHIPFRRKKGWHYRAAGGVSGAPGSVVVRNTAYQGLSDNNLPPAHQKWADALFSQVLPARGGPPRPVGITHRLQSRCLMKYCLIRSIAHICPRISIPPGTFSFFSVSRMTKTAEKSGMYQTSTGIIRY